MKIIFLASFFISLLTQAQTVHVEKGKIVYKGAEKTDQFSKLELYTRAKNALLQNVRGHERQLRTDDEKNGELSMNGETRLKSTFNILRVLEYSIKISVKKGEYKYKIDSVFVRQNERHIKTIDIPSEDLLAGMNITGNVAINTEKQLNEIDMDLQKLLALLHNQILEARK
ncbi:MAG: hypothetical protein NVS1B13_13110 [Flavisolibacter sp.]